MKTGNRTLLSGDCLIIGEVAQAHDGSLGMAHAFIDAIADAGADAVKFQTHIAAAESSRDEPWRIRFSPQDASRYDYWKRMEFTEGQWHGLRKHADERGLFFISSAFSVEAIELLSRVGVAAWKVASGEINNSVLFNRMVSTGLPILLSTGMSPMNEIDAAIECVKSRGLCPVVMQCTTAYPCPPERIGLNLIPYFRGRYDCPVGLSDHSGTIYPSLAAVTLGADVLEVHVTLSREMFGPDVPASVTSYELKQLIQGVRFIESMKAHPIDKDKAAAGMEELRRAFMKSVVAQRDLRAGDVLTESDLTLRKPGTGMPPERLAKLVGKRLAADVVAGELLRDEHLE